MLKMTETRASSFLDSHVLVFGRVTYIYSQGIAKRVGIANCTAWQMCSLGGSLHPLDYSGQVT